MKEKDYKEEESSEDMGLFGSGKGFLGLSKKSNDVVALVFGGLAIVGISYFLLIKEVFSAMATVALFLIILMETYREK